MLHAAVGSSRVKPGSLVLFDLAPLPLCLLTYFNLFAISRSVPASSTGRNRFACKQAQYPGSSGRSRTVARRSAPPATAQDLSIPGPPAAAPARGNPQARPAVCRVCAANGREAWDPDVHDRSVRSTGAPSNLPGPVFSTICADCSRFAIAVYRNRVTRGDTTSSTQRGTGSGVSSTRKRRARDGNCTGSTHGGTGSVWESAGSSGTSRHHPRDLLHRLRRRRKARRGGRRGSSSRTKRPRDDEASTSLHFRLYLYSMMITTIPYSATAYPLSSQSCRFSVFHA